MTLIINNFYFLRWSDENGFYFYMPESLDGKRFFTFYPSGPELYIIGELTGQDYFEDKTTIIFISIAKIVFLDNGIKVFSKTGDEYYLGKMNPDYSSKF